MRVLCVGNMYPPHHHGGYELAWHAAVEHLRSRGHAVRVITTDHRTDTTDPESPNTHRELRWHLREGEFERLRPRQILAMTWHNHRVLERHLLDFRPEVVTWWSMGGLSLTLIEAVRRRGLPAVAFVHDEWLGYGPLVDPWLKMFTGPRRSRVAPYAERLTQLPTRVDFAGAAEYVFVSDYTRRQAIDAGVDLAHTSIAHSGIHEVFLDAAPERDWHWRLLYVGRLDARKGTDTAVEVMVDLPAEARLTIIGGGDDHEKARLAELAQQTGLRERVVFAGQQSRDKVVAAYEDADVVIFPVRWNEPWGLVPLEAMGKGRPVVATGRGGSAEYLRDRENCLLFEAGDAHALAAALCRLAEEPALRGRLRAGGIRTAALHTEAVFNDAVEAALTRCARTRR